MTTRRLSRFDRGQPVSTLRKPLNRIVDEINGRNSAPAGAAGANPGFLAQNILWVEIRALNAQTLTCTLGGNALNPSAFEYEVELPQTLTYLSSPGGVNYVYSDINHRVADGTENQELTPIYSINQFIVLANVRRDNGEVFYVDLNIDGRQFAKLP